jgi:hypothetical protein
MKEKEKEKGKRTFRSGFIILFLRNIPNRVVGIFQKNGKEIKLYTMRLSEFGTADY